MSQGKKSVRVVRQEALKRQRIQKEMRSVFAKTDNFIYIF